MPIKILRRVLEHREMTMVLLFQREISSAVVKDLRFENKDKDLKSEDKDMDKNCKLVLDDKDKDLKSEDKDMDKNCKLVLDDKDKDFLRQQQHWATVKNGLLTYLYLLTYLHTYIDLSVIIWHQ